jgi:hypothetical protein
MAQHMGAAIGFWLTFVEKDQPSGKPGERRAASGQAIR